MSSTAADKRIAELEQEVQRLQAQLVQRDVYEAEQRLPPEQAALIKHLETVEKCIEHAENENEYEDTCFFCDSDPHYHGHNRDCAWLLLQLDRGVTRVMDELEDVARREHARRARPATPPGPRLTMTGLNEMLKQAFPNPVSSVYASDDRIDALRYGIGVTFAPQRATIPAHEVHSDSRRPRQPGGEGRREEHHEGDPSLPHRPDDEQR